MIRPQVAGLTSMPIRNSAVWTRYSPEPRVLLELTNLASHFERDFARPFPGL